MTADVGIFVKHSICKLSDALQELSQHMKVLQRVPGQIDIPISLVSAIEEEIAVLKGKTASATEIYENVRLVDCHFLLEGT